ncbi:MAG TPA: hypothetical protein VJA21_34120 [Verrucomicrobiae bacterium]
MRIRQCGLGLLAGLITLGGGCRKSTPEDKASQPVKTQSAPAKPVPPESAARVHWLGMKRLLAETNAAGFKALWELPETSALLSQTLNKLALAPWRQSIPALQPPITNYQSLITNYPSLVASDPMASLARPLLEDLVGEECYLEVRLRTNQPGEAVLAVRLDDQRHAAWQTNLLAIGENLSGSKASAESATDGWTINLASGPSSAAAPPSTVSFTRSGGWTLLSLSSGQSALLADLTGRIKANPGGNPFQPGTTSFWLEAHLDSQRLWPALAQKIGLPIELPRASLTCIGDGKDVQSRGTLTFSKPLPFTIEKWNLPTTLLHEPLDSSTGLQGIRPWLQSLKLWKDLDLGEPPNQIFWWARWGIPFHSYSAAATAKPDELLDKIRGHLLKEANPWLATNATGYFENSTNRNAVLWKVVPFIAPIIESATNGGFLVAGLAADTSTNPPPSAETLQGVISRTNVFYYDWELTGSRIGEWLYIGQLFRVIFNKPQLPKNALSVAWLKALEQKLLESRTVLSRTGPEEVSFARGSGLGLTAIELHLMIDWLESPEFPGGLYTWSSVNPRPPRPAPRASTSSGPNLKK